ncbi:MAG: hypothetical protein ACXACI_12795 [Candidatus Hodarchaeales archaeon]|jgi:hypothetical protein
MIRGLNQYGDFPKKTGQNAQTYGFPLMSIRNIEYAKQQMIRYPLPETWGIRGYHLIKILLNDKWFAFPFDPGKALDGSKLIMSHQEFVAKIKDLVFQITQPLFEKQNLQALREALPEIHPGMDVPLATIQQRILGDNFSTTETERLLFLLQDEGTLPGRYDRITQTFRREGDQKESLQPVIPAEKPFSSRQELTCRFCGELLSEEDASCPDCGKEVTNCAICRIALCFGEAVGLCPYCFTPFHEQHMREAVKVQGKCPLCQTELAENEIIRQEPGKKK